MDPLEAAVQTLALPLTVTTREPQLGRLRPTRGQGPRSVVRPGQGVPLLTVVDRW
jgi:hypothetical protein